MPRTTLRLALLALAGLASCIGEQTGDTQSSAAPPAETASDWDGSTITGHLADNEHRDFRLMLPADSGFFCLQLRGGRDDVDLMLAANAEDLAIEAWHRSSTESHGNESIELMRNNEPQWANGAMYVRILNVESHEVAFELEATIATNQVDDVIAPGETYRSEIRAIAGYRRVVRIPVPKDASALRLDLHGVRHDLDLLALHGAVPFDSDDAEHEADSLVACESLVLTTDSDPPLQPGRDLFAVVQDARHAHDEVRFELLVTRGTEPPVEIDAPTPLRVATTPRRLALQAAVKLITPTGWGSGTIVRSDGLVLAASHVIKPFAEDNLVVAFTLDPRELPEERYRCRLVARESDLDLALLQIDRTLYGRELTEPLQLPACPIHFSAEPALGDALYTVGYPGIGGSSARTAISWSEGLVIGFDPSPLVTEIKTDALIASGSSGGAALDARFRLIGVISSAAAEEDGAAQLGYVVPVMAMPDAWRERIARPALAAPEDSTATGR